MEKLIDVNDLAVELRKDNKKVVLVHGIFDILHKGHIVLLSESRKLGDVLVVGLETDSNAKFLKGPKRPFNSFDSRAFVLKHIVDVDYIFKIPNLENNVELSEFYLRIYRKIKPSILATNLEAGKYGQKKKIQAEQCGIKFVNIPEVYYPRPTELLK